MEFDDSFFKEEVKWDHVITTPMKKVWAVELQILEAFDRICKKHGLRYFAAYGTLLGVVRHQGFIPWDDDLDVVMFRPEYEKMKTIIEAELPEEYEFQSETSSYRFRSFSKIRDARTTGIEYKDAPLDYNQGLFIDIFPLDDGCESPEDITPEWQMKRELWLAVSQPEQMLEILSKEHHLVMPEDILRFAASDPYGGGIKLFNDFCNAQFGKSSKVQLIVHELNRAGYGQLKEWYDETVYMPFENFSMPVPKEYEKALIHRFGPNYMEPIKFASLHNGIILDAERPYKEVLKELKGS